MLIRRGWNRHTDAIRDELWANHSEIHIIDVSFFSLEVFNQCESSNDVLLGFGKWQNVHPLLRIVPVEWDHTVPFGILHSPKPAGYVSEFLEAVSKAYSL